MTKYEVMFIVKTTLDENTVKATAESLKSVITEMNGKVENTKEMGQRTLAYPINKEVNGFYYVLTVEASNEAIAELQVCMCVCVCIHIHTPLLQEIFLKMKL